MSLVVVDSLPATYSHPPSVDFNDCKSIISNNLLIQRTFGCLIYLHGVSYNFNGFPVRFSVTETLMRLFTNYYCVSLQYCILHRVYPATQFHED